MKCVALQCVILLLGSWTLVACDDSNLDFDGSADGVTLDDLWIQSALFYGDEIFQDGADPGIVLPRAICEIDHESCDNVRCSASGPNASCSETHNEFSNSNDIVCSDDDGTVRCGLQAGGSCHCVSTNSVSGKESRDGFEEEEYLTEDGEPVYVADGPDGETCYCRGGSDGHNVWTYQEDVTSEAGCTTACDAFGERIDVPQEAVWE